MVLPLRCLSKFMRGYRNNAKEETSVALLLHESDMGWTVSQVLWRR